MRTIGLMVGVVILGVIGTAAAKPFNPVPSGSNFSYFTGTCGRAVERTAYYSLAIIDAS